MLRPLSPEESKEYLAKFVNPVLSEALAEVTRRKPVDPLVSFRSFRLKMSDGCVLFLVVPLHH